jgi:magnesium transporter
MGDESPVGRGATQAQPAAGSLVVGPGVLLASPAMSTDDSTNGSPSPAPRDTIVRCALYSSGRRVRDLEIAEARGLRYGPGDFVWVGLVEPSETTLREVQRTFGLHDLAVEDALRAHQRPKLEEYGESFFVVLRTASWNDERVGIDLAESHFFVGPHYLVSVRHGSDASFAEVRARCEAAPEQLARGSIYAFYQLMDFVVDHYFPVVDALEESIEALAERLFSDLLEPQLMQNIFRLRSEIRSFKQAVLPLLEVCNRLTRPGLALVPEESRLYFRDIYDHVIRVNEAVDNQREVLHAAFEGNLALVSVRQNETMRKLAGWAAIIAVPNLLAAIWGMNLGGLPGQSLDWAFFTMVGTMLVLSVVMFVGFRRSGWL